MPLLLTYTSIMPEFRGKGGGSRSSPLENHKAIGFLISTGLDPLENHKAIKPAFYVRPS